MRTALEKATSKPALGFLLGMFVTCMIQSSTATIVLTVGLVGDKNVEILSGLEAGDMVAVNF